MARAGRAGDEIEERRRITGAAHRAAGAVVAALVPIPVSRKSLPVPSGARRYRGTWEVGPTPKWPSDGHWSGPVLAIAQRGYGLKTRFGLEMPSGIGLQLRPMIGVSIEGPGFTGFAALQASRLV